MASGVICMKAKSARKTEIHLQHVSSVQWLTLPTTKGVTCTNNWGEGHYPNINSQLSPSNRGTALKLLLGPNLDSLFILLPALHCINRHLTTPQHPTPVTAHIPPQRSSTDLHSILQTFFTGFRSLTTPFISLLTTIIFKLIPIVSSY